MPDELNKQENAVLLKTTVKYNERSKKEHRVNKIIIMAEMAVV